MVSLLFLYQLLSKIGTQLPQLLLVIRCCFLIEHLPNLTGCAN